MMEKLYIRKLANALIPSSAATSLIGGSARIGVSIVERYYGGLWIGGHVELSNAGIIFRPNSLNSALHVGGTTVSLPIESIRSIRRKFGFLTGIVVVEHEHGQFQFRCFGALKVARTFANFLSHASA